MILCSWFLVAGPASPIVSAIILIGLATISIPLLSQLTVALMHAGFDYAVVTGRPLVFSITFWLTMAFVGSTMLVMLPVLSIVVVRRARKALSRRLPSSMLLLADALSSISKEEDAC